MLSHTFTRHVDPAYVPCTQSLSRRVPAAGPGSRGDAAIQPASAGAGCGRVTAVFLVPLQEQRAVHEVVAEFLSSSFRVQVRSTVSLGLGP